MASEPEWTITVVEAELKGRDARDGAWESPEQRRWFEETVAALGKYQAATAADRASGLLSERGIAATAAGHRDDPIWLIERFAAKARDRRAAEAATNDAAWKDELMRPPGVSEVVDTLQLADMGRQLGGLPDHEQHVLLLEDSPRGRLCRRAAYAWPSVRPFGLPQTAADVRAAVVVRRGPQGSAAAEARDLEMLASALRRAVGLVPEPVLQSSRGDGA
jgi:hypothetical protein